MSEIGGGGLTRIITWALCLVATFASVLFLFTAVLSVGASASSSPTPYVPPASFHDFREGFSPAVIISEFVRALQTVVALIGKTITWATPTTATVFFSVFLICYMLETIILTITQASARKAIEIPAGLVMSIVAYSLFIVGVSAEASTTAYSYAVFLLFFWIIGFHMIFLAIFGHKMGFV